MDLERTQPSTKAQLPNADLEERLERAAQWLVGSGIQNPPGAPKLAGGFNAWFDRTSGTYPYVYSEITGYLITSMVSFWKQTGDEKYLESAQRAAQWLLTVTRVPSGGFRWGEPITASKFDFKKNHVYAFDCGIILNGLVSLYRALLQANGSRKEAAQILDAAKQCADWLIGFVQKKSGAFFPVYDLDAERFIESNNEWSTNAGSYHSKIAIGLLNLHDVTRQPKYKVAAEKICDFALTCQEKNGRFICFLPDGGTNVHPHCYSAEGLWVAGRVLNRDDYLEASSRAMKWLLDLQSDEGNIPRLFIDQQPIYNERVDALSQTLRLSLLHLSESRLPDIYRDKANRLATLILPYQINEPSDARVHGGFAFGKLSDGTLMPHINSWVTSFATQALTLWGATPEKQAAFDPYLFV